MEIHHFVLYGVEMGKDLVGWRACSCVVQLNQEIVRLGSMVVKLFQAIYIYLNAWVKWNALNTQSFHLLLPALVGVRTWETCEEGESALISDSDNVSLFLLRRAKEEVERGVGDADFADSDEEWPPMLSSISSGTLIKSRSEIICLMASEPFIFTISWTPTMFL